MGDLGAPYGRTIAGEARETDGCFRRLVNCVNCGAPFQNLYIFLTILQALMATLS